MAGCAAGKFNKQIFGRVMDYAKKASLGQNPAAVFISLLKKELNYNPKAIKAGQLWYRIRKRRKSEMNLFVEIDTAQNDILMTNTSDVYFLFKRTALLFFSCQLLFFLNVYLLFLQGPGNTAHIPLGWIFAFNP